MNTTEPQIITVRPSPKHTELKGFLGLLLLLSAVGYLHWTLGKVLAWWLLTFLILLLTAVIVGLWLWLWRAHNQSRSRTRLEQEYFRQEQERTAELQVSRMKAEAELQEAKARACKAEREAEFSYIVAGHDDAVIVRETNTHAVWRPMHLNPRQRINGVDQPPTLLEMAAWEQWQTGRQSALPGPVPPIAQLAGATLPERVDLLELTSGRSSLRQIVLGVRVDEQGQIRVVSAPLNRMVHIGAAGATDSGKSNFGRVVAVQVATAIEDVLLVFVDLKETTFKIFREVDRLLYPVITTPADFVAAIDDLYGEMERRKRLFAPHITVETLADYNKIAPEPLPLIAIFVDEVSNLFMNKETQRLALALIRESRGFGIHFITLGQSWSHKEMDVSFREQHRTTGHFGTNNPHSSRMMINKPDAVQITVPGRAYFSLPFGMSRNVVEIQTPYIDPATALRLLPGGTVSPTPPPPNSIVVVPTETEARVLAGWDAGERRLSIIAEAVYSNKGGKQLELVRDILRRWGRLTEECTGVPGVPGVLME